MTSRSARVHLQKATRLNGVFLQTLKALVNFIPNLILGMCSLTDILYAHSVALIKSHVYPTQLVVT